MSVLNSIIGSSQEVLALRKLISTVGKSDSTALILGESGTGKDLAARALHESSSRKMKPFIPVNCGAIPKDLLESELFGHKKGSFTGAISDRKGRFQLAHQGTLFLDEIGDMSLDLQVKLLRVLQERQIDPVGSTSSVDVDVRVIAATHKNIESLIHEGKFRQDLYYRLNVLPIEIPSLFDRKSDVPELVSFFAQQHAEEKSNPITLNNATMRIFLSYQWPGNIRELSNLIARYSALMPGAEIDLRDIPLSMIPALMRKTLDSSSSDTALSNETISPTEPIPLGGFDDSFSDVERIISLAQGANTLPEEGLHLKEHLMGIERDLIQQALMRSDSNVSKTARLLGLQRTTLIEKINKHNLQS